MDSLQLIIDLTILYYHSRTTLSTSISDLFRLPAVWYTEQENAGALEGKRVRSMKYDYDEMNAVLSDIRSNRLVQKMKNYVQHGKVSTYDHCESVARLSYIINRCLYLHSDLKVLLVGAMLHDFYLYDWHNKDGGSHRLHGLTHAEKASSNARKYFGIDDRTGHVIACHMWPLNPARIPLSREAWIVCIADKCVSLYETVFRR